VLATYGEALAVLRRQGQLSHAVTFITGPSRTADIELTLAMGVHGPREVYVILVEA
jgi:L-lactate dehydrogenase complex protein LldG